MPPLYIQRFVNVWNQVFFSTKITTDPWNIPKKKGSPKRQYERISFMNRWLTGVWSKGHVGVFLMNHELTSFILWSSSSTGSWYLERFLTTELHGIFQCPLSPAGRSNSRVGAHSLERCFFFWNKCDGNNASLFELSVSLAVPTENDCT